MKIWILVSIMVFVSSVVNAHPPKKVVLDYDLAANTLKVEADHDVKDTLKHYIGKMEVFINDKIFITQTYKSQLDNNVQKAVYFIIDAKPGDTISVNAKCNIMGSKKESLIVTASQK